MSTKQQNALPFKASYYDSKLRENINDLAISTLTAHELWGQEVPKEHFRNCLAGDEKKCATVWKEWAEKRIIEDDDEKSYFILKHQFVYNEKKYEKWAVFAAIDLESSEILEHEKISTHAMENAKHRALACRADLTTIYIGIEEQYSQQFRTLLKGLSNKNELLLKYAENDFSKHEIYKISNTEKAQKVHKFISDKKLYLLDGHHRLAAAKEILKEDIGDGKILSCISTMSKEELIITPIHRIVIENSWINPETAINELKKKNCSIKKAIAWDPKKIHELIEQLKVNEFYLLPAQRTTLFLMEVKKMEEDLIIDTIEKIFSSMKKNIALLPAEEFHPLMNELANGQAQAAIFLPNISPKNVRERANSKKNLPRKSTKFLPKPVIGLLTRNWEA